MTPPDGLRADARRNRAQVLAAAREVVVERGAGAPLEEVARRAGVGIGTLYRRFGDRDGLLRAVVVDALERSRRSAEQALAGLAGDEPEGDGLDALAAYMHAVLDLRVSVVIPLVLDRLDLDDAVTGPAREASAAAVQALVDAAHADGSLAPAVRFGDVGTLLVRLSRPLPGPVDRRLDDELAHRHLDLALAGLRHAPDVLDRPGPERRDLGRDGAAAPGGPQANIR